MYLKRNKIILVYLLICVCCFTSSCMRIIEDPAKKYNEEFLKNNYMKIKRYRDKHLKLAENYDIYYRDDKVDLVDSKYYNATDGTKLKKEYRSRKYKEEHNKKHNDIEYLNQDLSIYHTNRTLKDVDDLDECGYNCDTDIMYVENNYKDYSSSIVSFDDVKINNMYLYGDLSLRKEKDYNYVDGAVLQANFDYIDVMNRVKEELYLRQKSEEIKKKTTNKDTLNNIKSKFLNLFNGK